jgi:D-alanine-D-alanine ligase
MVVKPANCGSSAGVSRADNFEELEAAVKMAFSHDNKVVVEKFIGGRELEIAVFGYDTPECSCIGEINSSVNHHNSRDFFECADGMLKIPANIDENTAKRVRETAVEAFKALGCKGLARIDFLITDNNELFLNKVSTMPGFKADCIYPRLMKNSGIDMPELTDILLEQAIENAERTY